MENYRKGFPFSIFGLLGVISYIICTIYAVGCDKVKSNINYNSQVPSATTRKRVARHRHPPGDPLLPFGQFTLCRACGDETACVAERYLTLRIGCERHGRKNLLPFPMSKRSHIGNLRQIRKQGKGRSPKRKGNRRCPFLFAPAAGAATSRRPQTANPPAEVQRKTLRPERANPPAAVRVPRSAGAGKVAARIGANPPAAVRVPRSAGAGKEAAR